LSARIPFGYTNPLKFDIFFFPSHIQFNSVSARIPFGNTTPLEFNILFFLSHI